ncbi:MAG: translational GTPase TypA [Elusimicrobiota bacterium]
MERKDLRNIAIIAHVDHGKTTLVDAMLKQTGYFKVKDENTECVLDSNDLERERGITILSKNTSVKYKDVTIHIVDTPGHADFSSEVERVLKMVDGVLLLVDALDGPMPQTRFVLKKALELNLKPLVVINKIDRPNADPHKALDKVFSLFIDLNASDSQLDFPVIYASGKEGTATENLSVKGENLNPLFEAVIKHIPGPKNESSKPLRMLITMLDYSPYTGRIGIGRIVSGEVSKNQNVVLMSSLGKNLKRKVLQIMKFDGLEKKEVQKALCGDIAALYGLDGIDAGDTVSCEEEPGFLEGLKIDEPTVSMEFYANDGPFAGREGKFVNITQIRDRLYREAQVNVGLKVEEIPGESGYKVSGRGELHLSVLIETMRREGFELCVSKMKIIEKTENGEVCEPVEEIILDLPAEFQGPVMEAMGRRNAKMKNMETDSQMRVRLEYLISSRALIGFKGEFLTLTKGNGLMHQSFYGYLPKGGFQPPARLGVFIAKETGQTAAYALNYLQDHGKMFVGPAEDVYMGQIVGENLRDNDLVVNPCKEKKQSNMRSSGSDESILLTPPRRMSLEQALEYIAEDEYVEVTPKSVRMRKKVLDHSLRKRGDKQFI